MKKKDLKGLFNLAPQKAIEYFKNKKNKLSWDWFDVWESAHNKAFTVAKVARADILKDIRTAVNSAMSKGQTFEEFKKDLVPVLKKKGWWGEQFIVDSASQAEKIQLGSVYRLKLIYRTNMQVAYQAGRYKTQLENVDERPYWELVSVLDSKTRPEHALLNGLVFPYDDPFWQTHYPPLGFGCRCRVRALSADNVKRRKITVESSEGRLSTEMRLISKKSGEYAPVRVYTDPLTDKKIAPDVGWSYNFGS